MKTKKQSSSKMLRPLGSEPRTSDFTALHATIRANYPFCWKSHTFRSLYICAGLIFGLRKFFGIKRAWLYEDLKVWDFQQIGELAQTLVCRAVKSEALVSLPSEGDILLLVFFVFMWFCIVYRIHLYSGKTQLTSLLLPQVRGFLELEIKFTKISICQIQC